VRPIVVSVGPLTAAAPTGIALSQSLAATGPLTLNGAYATAGVATLPQPGRVGIVSAGNDSGMTWTITGTDRASSVISETLAGANAGAAQSVLDYATVTSIVGSAATASTVTAGTTGVAATGWVRLDDWSMSQTAIQCTASGTVNYTVQSTLDDPNSFMNPVAPALMTWVNTNDTNAVGAIGTVQTNFAYSPTYVRVLLNTGTGSVTMTVNQASSAVY
jgi:hypothetical protein